MGTDYRLFIQVAPKAVLRKQKLKERACVDSWRWITSADCETLGCKGYEQPLEKWGPKAAHWYADRSVLQSNFAEFEEFWEERLESSHDLTLIYHDEFCGEPVVSFDGRDLKQLLAFMPEFLGINESVKRIKQVRSKDAIRVVLTLC